MGTSVCHFSRYMNGRKFKVGVSNYTDVSHSNQSHTAKRIDVNVEVERNIQEGFCRIGDYP